MKPPAAWTAIFGLSHVAGQLLALDPGTISIISAVLSFFGAVIVGVLQFLGNRARRSDEELIALLELLDEHEDARRTARLIQSVVSARPRRLRRSTRRRLARLGLEVPAEVDEQLEPAPDGEQ